MKKIINQATFTLKWGKYTITTNSRIMKKMGKNKT